ncbi:MAG: hypothetical protein IKA87_03080 [Lentisphaeria bacterium]|nr:hypothetical protein [Lentisphaeria bacterium]
MRICGVWLLLLLLTGGCVESKVEYTKRYGFGFTDRKNYPKLKDYKLSLDLSSGSREFLAGKSGELIFVLRNEGEKSVKIPEWYKFDPNNLKVKCQIWVPGSRKPEPEMWLDVSAPVRKPVWRYPLTLGPGNAVFVSTKLDFIRNLIVNPGTERRYFVQARLNLKSVDVESPVRYISIRPGVMPKVPEINKKQHQQ